MNRILLSFAWGSLADAMQVMTAKAKARAMVPRATRSLEAVDFGSLAEALGANASEVGERMAQVRPSGGAMARCKRG